MNQTCIQPSKVLSGMTSTALDRRGAAAVEFAVSLSVLMLFVFVGIEFFRASILRHNVDCAAYEAARAAIFPGATHSDAIAAANAYLAKVGVTPQAITVSPDPIVESTAHINVVVQVAMDTHSWVSPSFLGGKMIIGRSRLMTERAPLILASAMSVPPTQASPPSPNSPPGPEPTTAPESTQSYSTSSPSPPPML